MNQNKFFKIFSIAAFIAFMFFSCLATVESLHLLLPSWPIAGFWVAAIGFFVLASMGSKLIVDSFNQRIRVDNRGWQLIGGILLLLVFWIGLFLPTNTHTFFYRSAIKDILVQDLTDTKTRLENLENEGDAKRIIDQDKAEFINKVNGLFGNFESQIRDINNIGHGTEAGKALGKLQEILGTFEPLRLRSNNKNDINSYIAGMRKQKDDKLDSYLDKIYNTRLANISRALDKAEIKKLISGIQTVQNKMQAMPKSNDEPTEKTSIILSQAYKIINNYSDIFINAFNKTNPDKLKLAMEDKKLFSGISKTQRMNSVIDVWGDFFAGKYAGRGFVFWIIIAGLVDIAGFIFFDIAFKRDNY